MANPTYNANSDAVRGDELFIYVDVSTTATPDYQPIAYATNTSIEISADTIDTANKMGGSFKTYLLGQTSWTLSTDALVTKATTAGPNVDKLFEYMKDRKAVKIMFGKSNNTASDDFSLSTPGWYSGQAYITSLSISADNGSVATLSCSLQGSGKLTIPV